MSSSSLGHKAGPLSAHGAGYTAYLVEQRYRPSSLRVYERAFRQLDRWLGRHHLGAGDLSPGVIEAFLADREGRWPPRARPEVVLGYLRSLGLAPLAPAPPASPLDALIDSYRRWLLEERRLASVTVRGYLATALRFTQQCAACDLPRWTSVGAKEVGDFILGAAQTRSPRTVNEIVVGLRSFLRFLHLEGLIETSLAEATPWMASGALATLPRGLEPGTAERLLGSCDRSRLSGVRDYAVLKLLSRLGLRAAEVAALELGDLDWQRGEVAVAGKGGRRDRLPMPIDLGEALVRYLTERGAAGRFRQVFLTVNAPRGPMTMSNVRWVVRAACARCGIPDTGTHRFRHGLATELLRAGAPLEEIGQVLRHGALKTTALYARVDLAAFGPRAALAGGHSMSALAKAAQDYLDLRRAVGFKLEGLERPLLDFVSYVETEGDGTITVALALAWAATPGRSPQNVAKRLGWVRSFARYLQARFPGHEVPPRGLLPSGGRTRRIPHLYSNAEVLAMMRGARRLRPASWAATVETVLGLLFVTGMRIGEVLGLDLDDIDWEDGLLTVWLGKFNKSRLIPLAPSSLAALAAYVKARNGAATERATAVFLGRDGHCRLTRGAFYKAFRVLLGDAGLAADDHRPHVHDLRHSFAVRTLLDWYREGVDVQARLPRLSTYLGHRDPASTYWYLSGTPELLGLVAERLERDQGGDR